LGTNPSVSDTDGDGLSDGDEVATGTDPSTAPPTGAPAAPPTPCSPAELDMCLTTEPVTNTTVSLRWTQPNNYVNAQVFYREAGTTTSIAPVAARTKLPHHSTRALGRNR
jgi:hypothetical protein